MKKAISSAIDSGTLGDDIYKDCPITNKLEQKIADLTGKQASIFCPSGTQTGLLSMMLSAPLKGQSVIMGNLSHIMNHEQCGSAAFGSIMPTIIPNQLDGTLLISDLEKVIPQFVDPHVVPTTAIALESSQ
jgi:threonine aldolase